MIICHIIGITALLTQGSNFSGNMLARVLKKEVKDLKSYCQELGLESTHVKEDGKEDLVISTV